MRTRAGGGGRLPPPRRGLSARRMPGISAALERRVMARDRGLPHGGARRPCRAAAAIAASSASPTTPAATGIARNARAWRAPSGWPTRQAELLPVPYFHVVFTLPAPVAEIAFQNKARRLRHPVPRRGRDAAHHRRRPASPRRRDRSRRRAAHLGAEPAAPSAHPLHRPRRRPVARRTRWVACRPGFFLPVRVLSRLFRRLFLDTAAGRVRSGDCASSARSPRWPTARPSAARLGRAAAASIGSSTPSGPSAAPSRCWPISAATPIASPSPTAG